MDPQEVALQTEALFETWLDAINAAIVGPTRDPRAQPLKAQLLQLMIRLDSFQRQGPGLQVQQATRLQQVLPALTVGLTAEQRSAFEDRVRRLREEGRFAQPGLSASHIPSTPAPYPTTAAQEWDPLREFELARERAVWAFEMAEARAREAARAQQLAEQARAEAEVLARAAEQARERAEAAQREEAEELVDATLEVAVDVIEASEELHGQEAVNEEMETQAGPPEEVSEETHWEPAQPPESPSRQPAGRRPRGHPRSTRRE